MLLGVPVMTGRLSAHARQYERDDLLTPQQPLSVSDADCVCSHWSMLVCLTAFLLDGARPVGVFAMSASIGAIRGITRSALHLISFGCTNLFVLFM